MIRALALKVRAVVEASRKAALLRQDRVRDHGTVNARRVREGSEAEASRVVGSLTVLQIAMVPSLCGFAFRI